MSSKVNRQAGVIPGPQCSAKQTQASRRQRARERAKGGRMPGSISSRCVACAVVGLLLMSAAADTARAEPAKTEAPVPTPVDMQKRMELYRKKLADYTKAWDAYEKVAVPYWNSV